MCNTCDKKYMRKSSLEKHSVLCEFLIKTEREKQIQKQEETDIPSYHQLVNIVQQLSLKYSRLENEMEEMRKWVEKKKKKINVVNWLNTNVIPYTSFHDWVNTISINDEHFQLLMTNNIVDCFQAILEEYLSSQILQPGSGSTLQIYPIKCFSQKQNLFYIYLSDGGEWRQMTFEDFMQLFKIIQSKLLKATTEWKQKNKQFIEENDSASILYNKTLLKLMEISFTRDATFGKIKTNLYNYLKMDLKNLFEYEFEF